MTKKLNKVGYEVEVKFDGCWKVIVKFMGRENYHYLYDNENDAINKFNEII